MWTLGEDGDSVHTSKAVRVWWGQNDGVDGQFCQLFVTGVILTSASVHVYLLPRQMTVFIRCAVFGAWHKTFDSVGEPILYQTRDLGQILVNCQTRQHFLKQSGVLLEKPYVSDVRATVF